VLALAYLLLMGVGLIATERYDPSHWSSNRRSDSASLFTIGQWMLDTIGLRGLIPAVQRQLAPAGAKVGIGQCRCLLPATPHSLGCAARPTPTRPRQGEAMSDNVKTERRGGIDIQYDAGTGQLLGIRDTVLDMDVVRYAPGHEVEINRRGVPTTLTHVDDNPGAPAFQSVLSSVSHPAIGSHQSFNLFRSVVVGRVDQPFGNHLNPPQSLHVRYRLDRKRVDDYADPIAHSAGSRPVQMPLWLETFGALCGKTEWFGPETRMLQAAPGGAGPKEHVGVAEGPVAEVVPILWNTFRRAHPGVQMLPGAAYYHEDGRWLWITAQRPDVGMHWDYEPDAIKAQFAFHDRLAPNEVVYPPEVSLYWGKGGRAEMLERMANAFVLYEEPDDWFYRTTWFWLHWWQRRERGFEEMADHARHLYEELGVTGFGVAGHDVRPGCWDCSAGSLSPSPLYGGDRGMEKLGETIQDIGAHAFVWMSFAGLGNPGDIKHHWRLLGDDGRPYDSFSLGSFDLYNGLNFNHPEVRDYYLATVRQYVEDFGIDGIFWDCGGVPLPPDFAPPHTRPFQRFPGEAMVGGYDLMREIMRFGKQLSPDFFMWHETFSADLPGHGYSSHTGSERFLGEIAHAGRKRLVYRSGSTYNLDGGFAMLDPNQDTVFKSPISIDSYKDMVADPMNRWLVRFVADHGVRDARRIGPGAAHCHGHVVVDPAKEPRSITVPPALARPRSMTNVLTGEKVRPADESDAGATFALVGRAAYEINE